MSKISIIQVSYKNFETTTELCLKSLFDCEEFEDLEIILVDNVSGKETLSKIRSLISGKDNIKLIENSKNRGFPGGANDAIDHITGEIVFFLDIDTIVPSGMLRKLASHLAANPNWIVGPVTNQTGSEQKIFTKCTDPEKIIEEGLEWTKHAGGSKFQVKQLDFCCIGMTRKTLETIGKLEEGFGLGYYEDTDFCHRAGKLGFKLMLIEDAFIYHKGGGTNLSSKEKMRQSRDFFLNKHKLDGKTSLLRQRDLNLNVLQLYLERFESGEETNEQITYRIENRLRLADLLWPKNPFKKFFYFLKLRPIKGFFHFQKAGAKS